MARISKAYQREMAEQFTPAPWSMDAGNDGAVVHGNGATIADVPDYLIAWRANARLIQQAPELYTQLKALVGQIEHSGHLIVPPNVRAVLDKVEGKC